MLNDFRFRNTDYHLDIRGIVSVYQILGTQKMRGGNGDGSYFVQSHGTEPEFVPAFQDQHNRIPFPDTGG